jgi:hypothetical protein
MRTARQSLSYCDRQHRKQMLIRRILYNLRSNRFMDTKSINLEDLHVQNGNYEKFTRLIMKMAEDPDMADIILRMIECA